MKQLTSAKSGYRIENLDQIDEDLFNVDKLSDKPKISHDNIKSKNNAMDIGQ